MISKYFLLISKALFIILLTGAMSSPVFAAPTLDGQLSDDEYFRGWNVNFYLDNDHTDGPIRGELWLTRDNDYTYLAFIEPLGLVDNSYRQKQGPIDYSVDWASDNHKFDSLRGSDKAGFVFTGSDGNMALNIDVDYITGGDGTDVPNKKIGPFASGGGVAGDGAVFTGGRDDKNKGVGEIDNWDNDPDNDGSPLITAATSLEYNYDLYKDSVLFADAGDDPSKYHENYYSPDTNWDGAPLDYNPTTQTEIDRLEAAYTTTDSAFSNWIFDVIYEVKIDNDLLNGFGADMANDNYHPADELTALIAHVSSNKAGYIYTEIGDEIPGGEPVPEPATMFLLGSGLVGLAGFRKKFKKS